MQRWRQRQGRRKRQIVDLSWNTDSVLAHAEMETGQRWRQRQTETEKEADCRARLEHRQCPILSILSTQLAQEQLERSPVSLGVVEFSSFDNDQMSREVDTPSQSGRANHYLNLVVHKQLFDNVFVFVLETCKPSQALNHNAIHQPSQALNHKAVGAIK